MLFADGGWKIPVNRHLHPRLERHPKRGGRTDLVVNGAPSDAKELCFSTATDITRWIRDAGHIGPRCHGGAPRTNRARQLNGKRDRHVLLDGDDLMESALSADETLAKSGPDNLGPLYGLPVGIKDLQPTAGIRTTYGSPIFKDLVPTEDSLTVQRYKTLARSSLAKQTPQNSVPVHKLSMRCRDDLQPIRFDENMRGSKRWCNSCVGLRHDADRSRL